MTTISMGAEEDQLHSAVHDAEGHPRPQVQRLGRDVGVGWTLSPRSHGRKPGYGSMEGREGSGAQDEAPGPLPASWVRQSEPVHRSTVAMGILEATREKWLWQPQEQGGPLCKDCLHPRDAQMDATGLAQCGSPDAG